MSLNRAVIATLLRAELRMLLRDRRAIITSVLLPLVTMPLLLFSGSWLNRKREAQLEETVYKYAITGTEAATAADLVSRAIALDDERRARRPADDPSGANGTTPREDGIAPTENPRPPAPRFERLTPEDPTAALAARDIHFFIEGLTTAEAREIQAREDAEAEARSKASRHVVEKKKDDETPPAIERDPEAIVDGAPVLRFVFRADRDDSTGGVDRLKRLLRRLRTEEQRNWLSAHDFTLRPGQVAAIVEDNVASEGHVAGLTLGRTITLFLLLFLLPSAAVVATDSIAGEKERGTLETLLTTAAGHVEIIVAKLLGILAVTLAITFIQAANLLVYVGLEVVPLPPGLAAAVPLPVALLLLVLFLPLAALVSAVLLVVSGYARGYKEAQLYFLPVFLLGMVPALAPFLPGLPLRSAIVLVPIANIAVAARDILVGSFDAPMIVLAWLVTAGAAAWTTRLGVRFLANERLITAGGSDSADLAGGSALFGRHVLRWFAALWATLLIAGNYVGNLDVRLQSVINIAGFFFGMSLYLIHRYRLKAATVLAFRLPRPAVWIGVLLGAPSALLTTFGVHRLANLFFPVPREALDAFSRDLIPEGTPLWQILFFLAVIPGVFEEITFRGVLLHGLHRRLHPAALVAVVGIVFGVFHVALFRIVPTTFLGVVFATTTLLSGSIFPSMLWHTLHNAGSLLIATTGLALDELDPWAYGVAAAVLALSLGIIWWNRTPYPGLRPWRRTARR